MRRTDRSLLWMVAALMASLTLAGCGTRTPYYLIESKLVESPRQVGAADVTETPGYLSIKGQLRTLGLQPPDVCADQGKTLSGGSAQLQHGVLRTRCGVEMAEFERALSRAGYEVVSWSSVQHISSNREKSLLESARELGIEVLLQVNALERINVQHARDARFERRFYRATKEGERAAAARVRPIRAREFESLIEKKEASMVSGALVGATINVSAILVETGTTIWFYESTEVDEVAVDPEVSVLVDCENGTCIEVVEAAYSRSDGPVEGSISGVSLSGDPVDASQAIFHELVRRLAVDLAERLAGRRS